MQRALVTGGAGLIGSHMTAALLRARFRVRILDNLSPQIHGGVPRGLDCRSAGGSECPRGSVTSDGDRQLGAAFSASQQLVLTDQHRPGDIRHNSADITRLSELLDHCPRVGLAEGLQRFAAWVRDQPLPEDRLEAANAELSARGMMG
jgi:nucleoside-diphosphate-sugar epimerase